VQAHIDGMQEWKDGTGFPVLIIHANHPDNPEKDQELEALELIEKAVSDIVGKAYGGKIASTQNGSGQKGLFVVDLSAILTMLKAVKENETKTSAATAWVTNWLKKKIRPEWLPAIKKEKEKIREYHCRCGMIFKNKSKKKAKRRWIAHQKRCQVLKELKLGMFQRGNALLERLGKDDGRKKKVHVHKSKTGKAERHRSEKSAGHKTVVRRTKTRRTKRKDNPKSKR
jgi:hypothetical protein